MFELVKRTVAAATALSLLAVIIASVFLLVSYNRVQANIESIVNIDLPEGLQTTKVFASDYDAKTGQGTLLANLYLENREFVPLAQIPQPLIAATLASEDKRFYYHHGVDVAANLRAMLAILRHRALVQGGSTITQQLARNVFLPYVKSQKTLNRKVQEIILAQALERKFSKDEILESYLNNIFYGAGAYGVAAAASTYFGKDLDELSLAEIALIVGLPQKPSALNPYVNLRGAVERRDQVLNRLRAELHGGRYVTASGISDAEIDAALKEEVSLKPATGAGMMRAPYFTSWVREQLYAKYGEDQVLRQGLVVVTSLNWKYQQIAEKVVKETIDKYKDARRVSQAALVSLDVDTGDILALVGGCDYAKSKYNRAVQGGRQVGSAFKPFVYATALKQGIGPSTELRDLKVNYFVGPGQVYTPHNSDMEFRGIVNMVYALQYSRNAASVDLMNRVGPQNVVATAHDMGVESPLDDVLSLALGVCNVKPLEIASAFATFPRGGVYMEPVSILRVYDRNGVLLEDHTNDSELRSHRALPPDVAYTMVLMMQRVILGGTGTAARFKNGAGQYQPAGGKTGTTDDFGDAWFVGYTPRVATAVWVGNDDHRIKMRRVFGASIPAPIWKSYMQGIYADRPLERFETPPGAAGVSIPGASVRPVSELEDLQIEGEYTYPFEIDVSALPEEEPVSEEEKPPEERETKPPPEEKPREREENPVYF
ncbi:MAG: hypothetical protein B1H03_03100 [Planctomycetales bacterium 4484_113]|nr:MAG: hypothetical protein B1H03_03100 [Planctomycetales bacterium 4484_113]